MAFDFQPTMVGDLLAIRPLGQDDFDTLFAVASDPLLWEQHPAKNRWEEPVFRQLFAESLDSGGAMIVTDRESKTVIGSSRYHAYDPTESEIEIGWTFLARSCWGGVHNRELKRLMLDHAFQFVASVVFLVGPDNVRSQRAVQKIGAKRDGTRTDGKGFTSDLYRIHQRDFLHG